LKIVYISKYAAYNPFGMDTRHIYLSRELVSQGHEVNLILSDANHNLKSLPALYEDTIDGVKVNWIKTLKYRKVYGVFRILSWLSFELQLRRFLRKNISSLDVVIVSSLSLLTILNGIYLKRKHQCKLVFEVRDIWPLILRRIKNLSSLNPAYKILARIEKRGYNHADLIVGTMPNLKEHVKSIIDKDKPVIWIPHLVNPKLEYRDTHRYHAAMEAFKKEDAKVIGYAGSVNKSSCLDVFIKAANALQNENIRFVILGEGPLLNEIKNLATSNHIHFYNKVNQNEVLAFLKDCDILYDGYFKSDLYQFGNSRNKYVEYCLAAKPIILSYEGFPLFVETHHCGIVIRPESVESIIEGVQLLVNKDQSKLQEMGRNALTFAEQHLKVKPQTEKLIHEIAL
jgi:glycosyltransferase involved in cell wall biosynthesis